MDEEDDFGKLLSEFLNAEKAVKLLEEGTHAQLQAKLIYDDINKKIDKILDIYVSNIKLIDDDYPE